MPLKPEYMSPKHIIAAAVLLAAISLSTALSAANAVSAATAPAASASAPAVQEKYVYHKVAKGESVYAIAKQYKVDTETIFRLNPGSRQRIWAGATLRLPVTEVELSPDEAAADTLNIRERLQDFITSAQTISTAPVNDLQDIKESKRQLSALNNKWNVYYTAKQAAIGDNEGLTDLASEYQQLCQDISDSLDADKTRMETAAGFVRAARFIDAQGPAYAQYVKQALALSATEALAPRLEELKAKEQVAFADIEKNYETAKAAAAADPSLAKQMAKVTDSYIALKSQSEKVQEAAYKPLFDRIKDYLFGLAAVTIILMFANMAQAKYKSYKEMKKNAKKLEQMRRQNDNEYPSI